MKSGIDYFPLDVCLDGKFELLEAEFGLEGFAAIVKLYQKIYGGEGYYMIWDEESALLFARRLGLSVAKVEKLVCSAVTRGLFNKELFEYCDILTSRGIQKRYFEIVSRRKEIEVDPRFLLVDPKQLCKNADISGKNVDGLWQNDDICAQNDDIRKQSKVKKSKVKQSNNNKKPVHAPVDLVVAAGDGEVSGGANGSVFTPKGSKRFDDQSEKCAKGGKMGRTADGDGKATIKESRSGKGKKSAAARNENPCASDRVDSRSLENAGLGIGDQKRRAVCDQHGVCLMSNGSCGWVDEAFCGEKQGKGKVVNGKNSVGIGLSGGDLQTGSPIAPTEQQHNRADFAKVCVLWQKSSGTVPTAHIKEELWRLLSSRGKKELEEAVCIAAEHNKVTLAYVKGILKNKAAGTLSPSDLAAKKKKDSRNKYASLIEEALRP